MKFIYLPILLILLIGGFTMCNKSSLYSEDLLLIDKLAQSNPDSAYSIIKTYNTTKLLTSYDSAFYNLLLAEIRYKTYYNDTTEKDISNAANFFLKKEDNYNAMRSLFYQGISRSNKGAYYPAIQSLLLAIEKSDSTKDFFYRGNIYKKISHLFNVIGDYPSQNKYAKLAWHNYVMADTLPFIIQSQLWYGTSLCNLKHVKEATALMEDAENKARKYQDPDLIEMALSEVGNAYLWQKEYQKAKKEYTDLEKRVGLSNMTEHDLRLYLYSLVHLGEYNDTTEMVAKQLEKIVGNTKVNHEYFLHRNDYKMAFEAMKGMYDSLNNDLSARRINDTNLLLASYNQEKIKQTTLELKVLQREKFWITVTSILVIGFIIIISYFFIQRKKLKIRSLINETAILTQEYHFLLESQKSINYSSDDHCSDKKETVNNAVNDNPGATECRGNEKEIVNIEENSEFENSPENDIIGSPESDKDNDALLPTKKKQNADNSYSDESVIHSLFLSTIERLDSLHHQYLKGYAKQEDILKIMQCEINKLRNDNKFISKLEELINRDTDGILFEVYESIGKMKFDQRKLLIYLYYGLTTNMICLLLEIEPNGLYNRKNRLLNKIKASVSERKSILINKLRRNYT